MIVIFEGQAKTGKTTLIKSVFNKISQTQPIELLVEKFERPDDPLTHDVSKMLPMAFDDKIHLVDRGYITEVIFSELNRRKVTYSPEDWAYFDKFLSLGSALLVHVICDDEDREKRRVEAGRASEGDTSILSARFYFAVKRSMMNKICVDTSQNSLEQCASFVAEAIMNVYGGKNAR